MVDLASALPEAASSGAIRVEEAGLCGMITIRGDLTDATFTDAVQAATGIRAPAERGMERAGANALLWMSPDELMLTCDHDAAGDMVGKLESALANLHHLAVNVSDARGVFRLSGEDGAVRDTLAKLTPADMSVGACPVGAVRRTRLAQAAAAFWFEAEGEAMVVCFRSAAGYVFELLKTASTSGAEPGYFAGD